MAIISVTVHIDRPYTVAYDQKTLWPAPCVLNTTDRSSSVRKQYCKFILGIFFDRNFPTRLQLHALSPVVVSREFGRSQLLLNPDQLLHSRIPTRLQLHALPLVVVSREFGRHSQLLLNPDQLLRSRIPTHVSSTHCRLYSSAVNLDAAS